VLVLGGQSDPYPKYVTSEIMYTDLTQAIALTDLVWRLLTRISISLPIMS